MTLALTFAMSLSFSLRLTLGLGLSFGFSFTTGGTFASIGTTTFVLAVCGTSAGNFAETLALAFSINMSFITNIRDCFDACFSNGLNIGLRFSFYSSVSVGTSFTFSMNTSACIGISISIGFRLCVCLRVWFCFGINRGLNDQIRINLS